MLFNVPCLPTCPGGGAAIGVAAVDGVTTDAGKLPSTVSCTLGMSDMVSLSSTDGSAVPP